MDQQIIDIEARTWRLDSTDAKWIAALEAGKVLHFPQMEFALDEAEKQILTPAAQAPGTRSITLDARGRFKGAAGDPGQQAVIAGMIGRFRAQAQDLVHSLLPAYKNTLKMATTSYRPLQVETRVQSWRSDDKRLHVDAFAGRPNHGERILRVFTNINPNGIPRVWRVGEPFEEVARRFLPRTEPYSRWHAYWLRAQFKTKKVRSEYDHLMLQLHDCMKADPEYQKTAKQVTIPFASGSTWVCFSDQASHAAMSGQFMMEQTLHISVDDQYDPQSSPLAILTRLKGHKLV
ncbi:Kdo hydroxylase family protein [Noviherbaspirillum massiliense]|uniref:Kdo hydroxylase family protein n=1 Tax=Noviherbaspirillum massiliense TaxID=1465823 RepID=UPI0002EDBE33|nr:Kdo hydroxylase family protein [Noviherbaspirillum massiliense]